MIESAVVMADVVIVAVVVVMAAVVVVAAVVVMAALAVVMMAFCGVAAVVSSSDDSLNTQLIIHCREIAGFEGSATSGTVD